MSLFSALTEKPWEQPGAPHLTEPKAEQGVRLAGLTVLLSVVSALFLLFFIAFIMRSQYPDWQPLAEEPSQPLFVNVRLWLNSLYLFLASVCLHWSYQRSLKALPQALIPLWLAGAFGLAFVAGQLLFWQHLGERGFFVNDNPALSFFFLLTGVHAAHMLAALLAWVFALVKLTQGHASSPGLIQLCGRFWHFLLGLWLFLFALLTSKPETYDAIAAFCGLEASL